MQFLILLTGVLVFVFYHFHPAPLLWNRAELSRLQAATPPAEMQELETRFVEAERARALAAEALTQARREGARPDPAPYLAAQQALDAVRGEARQRVERMTGKGYNDTNYIFPSYILSTLPAGLAGLVIGVIFAAAMSALSGELSALASASMVDFYKRYVRPGGSDAHDILVSRLLTAFWGGLACLVAMQAGRYGSAIEVVNRFGSYFYGSILGVFSLAALAPQANARGAFYGLFMGLAAVIAVAVFTPIHFLWYNVIGAATVYVTGLLISFAFPVRTRA
jgi:SSS family solute:Na+ symporter